MQPGAPLFVTLLTNIRKSGFTQGHVFVQTLHCREIESESTSWNVTVALGFDFTGEKQDFDNNITQ